MKFHTREICERFQIRPIKSLGQNFLNDSRVVQEIVSVADICEDDLVIEVGPGLGIMTCELAQNAGEVIAVEIDSHLIPVLEELRLSFPNITVLNKDIMKLDVAHDILPVARKSYSSVKVAANLPYYITTPIIMKFLEEQIPELSSLTFMVQKEVAERMTAGPGGKEYGALSVAVGYFAEGNIQFTVNPACFYPRPNVDSSVVTLKVRKEPPFPLEDKDFFFQVVKAAFGQRRKMLPNALANAFYLRVSHSLACESIQAIGKDVTIRGETLKPEEFAALSNFLFVHR